MSSSSSSSLQRECRQFSLCEIKDATNDFDQGKVIGRGGEGTVYDSVIYDYQKKTNTRVAVKCLSTNSNCFEEEIRVVSDLHHANIVSLIGYCNESDHKILVYEFMDKGSLADNLKKGSFALSWEQWLTVCIGVARGLEYLHSGTNIPKGIIHRDLKPANILLDGNCEAKISDFGLFKVWPPDQESSHISTQLKGTPGYVAPECIKNHKITNKIDVYSFSMVLFEVLCGKSPWTCGGDDSYYPKEDDNLGHWALKNIDADLKQVISDDCLKAFTDVIGKTSRRNPVTRPTMNEVVLELENALKMQEHDKFRSYLQITLPKVPTDASRKFPWTGSDVTYYPREDDNLGQLWELHDIDSNPKHVISKDHSKEHTDSNGKTFCMIPTMKEDVLKLENALKMQEPRNHEINMCLPQVPLEPPNFSKLSPTSTAYRSFSITLLSATNLSSTVSNYWSLYADDSFSRMVNTMRKPWVDTLDSFHGSFLKYKSTFNYRVLQSSLQQDGALILVVKLYRRRIFGGDICVGLISIDLKKLFESGRSDTTNYPVQSENAQVTEGKLQFSYTFGDLESVDFRNYEHSLMGTTLLEDSKLVEYNFNELFSVALKLY